MARRGAVKGAIASVLFGLAAVTLAFAHTDVDNPKVLARMDNMLVMQDQVRLLLPMMRGGEPFDAARARGALAELAAAADLAPDLFRAPEIDPNSEARPEIWTSFGDFRARSDALGEIARRGALAVEDLDGLRSVMGEIRESCNGCHEIYRREIVHSD